MILRALHKFMLMAASVMLVCGVARAKSSADRLTLARRPVKGASAIFADSVPEQDGRHDHTFDMREHLREIAWRGEGDGRSLSMTYYADGRRATKTVKQGETVIRAHGFIWDGWLP